MKYYLLFLTFCQILTPENVRVHDGDTIVVDLPGVHPVFGKDIGVRMVGIDSPEIHDKNPVVREWAEKARKYLSDRVSSSEKVELTELSRDKYFRLDAKVLLDGKDIQDEMLRKGFAKPYDGGTKSEWKLDDIPVRSASADYASAYSMYPKVPMAVMVSAKWCPACPDAWRKLSEIRGRFSAAKVDIDSEQEIVKGLGGVTSLPTIFVFVHGKPSVKMTGYDEKRLRSALDGFLEQESDNVGLHRNR